MLTKHQRGQSKTPHWINVVAAAVGSQYHLDIAKFSINFNV